MQQQQRPGVTSRSTAFAEMLSTNPDSTAEHLVVSDIVPTFVVRTTTGPSWPPASQPGAEASLFQLMYAQLGRPATLEPFYHPAVFKNATILLLEGLAREFARKRLLVPGGFDAVAEGTYGERRLRTRPLSLWTMDHGRGVWAAGCGMSGASAHDSTAATRLNTVHVGFHQQKHGYPRQQLGHAGCPDRDRPSDAGAVKQRLKGLQFVAFTDVTGRFVSRREKGSESGRLQPWLVEDESEKKKKKHPWLPLAARLPLIILAFTTPLLSIAVLELLYHLLQPHDHLVLISNEDSAAKSYTIRIASTLTIFGLATLVNNLDFTIVTFASYSTAIGQRPRPAQHPIPPTFHLPLPRADRTPPPPALWRRRVKRRDPHRQPPDHHRLGPLDIDDCPGNRPTPDGIRGQLGSGLTD